MQVASAEFVGRGYAEASVSRIATDAGVSKKTIYARYGTKDELLLAVVSDLATRSHDAIVAAIAGRDATPARVLTNFGRQVARSWTAEDEVGFYRLVISEAPRFPQLAALYRDVMHRFGSTLASYLREQRELGTLAIADPDAAARQFGMLAYGEIREKALLGETVTQADVTRVVASAVRVFLAGYAPDRQAESGRV